MKINQLVLVVFMVGSSFASFGQKLKEDKKLLAGLNVLMEDFEGTAGVYVEHLPSGKFAAINADTVFPTASIVKIPILVGVFDKIEKGVLSYHEPLVYRDSLKYGGSGLMQFFDDSTKTDLSTLLALMITYSDNTTSLWNQALAGGGETINPIMDKYGMEFTRVNSRTQGRKENWEKYGWGQTTPREMATLLKKIRKGEIISPAASERMYRLMTNVYYDDYALSQIPPYIQTAAKQGMVNASRSELVMVNAPHGDYVFYIATKNNKDTRWEPDNASWVLAREVSAFLWQYFEPRDNWRPAEGSEKYHEGLAY
ncbi:serine hydrolase [Echinicola strongylocentroti]|uniref:Serine hydrolase n=1 Tax=Echinicola strongylocentroti TaxID=1795355 RepID=A0A2Z4INA7_9BACT|nr:serine hydrolase [Echinicola strongylocentroti]AWW32375.1 serine hydrolase [Echinicola strongylocentroti]